VNVLSVAPEKMFLPPEPTTVEETGLGLGFLSDLVLKVLYFQGYVTGGAKDPAAVFGSD
jgi:hypothetical protein